jgi:hypothetical protein
MIFLKLFILLITEISSSVSIRKKENNADKLFYNAEYEKALEIYVDLAKTYDEDSLQRYDLEYIESNMTSDLRYVRLMDKIIKCKSNIYNIPLEKEYSDLAFFITNNPSSYDNWSIKKAELILLANAYKNSRQFYEAIDIYLTLFSDFNRFDEEVRLNFIDCCIEENRINTALKLLRKVKSESEKQIRLNKCYNFLSNNLATCLEIGDTLFISRSHSGCLIDENQENCYVIKLKEGYKLLNFKRKYYATGDADSSEIDTLISEDFYNKIIDFESLIKNYEYNDVSEFLSRYREFYYFNLNGKKQYYSIEGYLEFDPELERVIF